MKLTAVIVMLAAIATFNWFYIMSTGHLPLVDVVTLPQ